MKKDKNQEPKPATPRPLLEVRDKRGMVIGMLDPAQDWLFTPLPPQKGGGK